jgi:hypothetical protein
MLSQLFGDVRLDVGESRANFGAPVTHVLLARYV